MTLLQSLFHLTNFKSPLLQTLVPSVGAAFAIQAAFAVPSIAAQSERFYDFSGSLTYLTVTALSLYLPALRLRHAANVVGGNLPLPSLLSPFTAAEGGSVFNWRQVVLSGAVSIWAARLGLHLFQRVLKEGKDSRFDEIKKSPQKFGIAFFAQATWVSLCLMPVIAVNSIPAAAFAAVPGIKVSDLIGLSLFAGGLAFEVTADWQKSKWKQEKDDKLHDEQFLTRGLWSKSQYPNYFGESTLWVGVATAGAGVLLSQPVRLALGLSPLAAVAISYVSPAFVTLLLLKVSGVPLSEAKYDKKFGDRADYQEWKKNTPKFFPKLF